MLPGLALSGALAATGIALGRIAWLQDHGFSALTLAIAAWSIPRNTVLPVAPRAAAVASGAGVSFSKQNLLRLGVVLYGLRAHRAGHRPCRHSWCRHRHNDIGLDLRTGLPHRHALAGPGRARRRC